MVESTVNLTPPANPVPVRECTTDFIGIDPCSTNSLLGFAGGFMSGYLGTAGSTPGARGAGQRLGFVPTVKGTIESCKGMTFEVNEK